jgi:uncharacterized protein involved in exopolysaccharide biosynthesis
MKPDSKRHPLEPAFALARRLRNAAGLGLTLLVVGGVLSYVATFIVKPVFRSETVLLYRESIRAQDSSSEERDPGTRVVGGKLREMLLARSKLEPIMDQFDLYPRIRNSDKVLAVETFRKAIDFKINENTFSLTFDAEDRALAQKVTERLAEGLIEESSKLRRERAEATKAFLEATKKRNDEELKVFENRYAKFLQIHPEFVAIALNPNAVQPAATKKPNATRNDLHVGARDAVEQKKAALRARIAGGGALLKTEELKNAEAAVSEAEAELKEVSRKFTENHPDVAAARSRLALARGARDRAKVLQPLPLSEADRAQLQQELNRLERLSTITGKHGADSRDDTALLQEGDAIVKAESEWASLNRDVQEARERNKLLDDRLFKATIALNVEIGNAAAQLIVVDPAYLPVAPRKNGKTITVGTGLALSAAFVLLVLLVMSRRDDRLYAVSEVEALKVGIVTVLIPRNAPGRAAARRG